MARLTRILKDYREAGTLSGLIALWGFIDTGAPGRSPEQGAAVFVTKAGAVGLATASRHRVRRRGGVR